MNKIINTYGSASGTGHLNGNGYGHGRGSGWGYGDGNSYSSSFGTPSGTMIQFNEKVNGAI